jgi:glycosyltransferase involved in cell wall biosynthesis
MASRVRPSDEEGVPQQNRPAATIRTARQLPEKAGSRRRGHARSSAAKGETMISVIIPTYNRSLFLERAVRSVIHQTLPPWELVIVDDGSTDNTRMKVAELVRESPIPIHYIHQNNKGAAAARNRGIQAARGDTLSFLDSDDCYVPEKLARQYAYMGGSSFRVSHTRETWYRRGTLLNQKRKHQPPHGDIFQASLRMCMIGMSTVMIRREIFEAHGLFDESLPCCEDYDYWLRVGATEHFLLVDEPLTIKHGGRHDQLSVIHRRGMDKYRIRSLVDLLERNRLSADQRAMVIAELDRKCSIYGKGCIKHGRVNEAREYLHLADRFKQEAGQSR